MNIYAERIELCRKMMREHGWNAIVIGSADPHSSEYPAPRWQQVKWLTGFTGEAGDVVITPTHAGLWTDSRYFIQALKQLEGTGVELHKTRIPGAVGIPEWLAGEDFQEDGLACVAFDSLCISDDFVESLREAFGGKIELSGIQDLLSPMWIDRPDYPTSPIIAMPEEITGESTASKIEWLRDVIRKNGCTAMLLSSLDEIAWLLNVRGGDIDYNPLIISHLFVSESKLVWFVLKDKYAEPDEETACSFSLFEDLGGRIEEYDDVALELETLLGEDDVLWIDGSSVNYALTSSLENVRHIKMASPIPLRKAVKNEVEIEGFRDAHLADGISMEKFLYWLETSLSEGETIDERDAAEKLDAIRMETPGCLGNSFETISAYGENAALPHYVTLPSGGAVLKRAGLYLNDSGAQYMNGTTDITRTVPLGPCSRMEKEDYTLVLKGHIDLALAVFPAGTPGCRVDALAREPLWRFRRNFGHGTGHGVGHHLCVHEGPQDIRQNLNACPLMPGMICSDEPGIYREGMYGIRHENLILCKDAGTNEFGEWCCFETLTLCHIDTSAIIPELLGEDEIAWLNAYNKHVFDTLSPHLPPLVVSWLKEKTAAL